jgi:hypothetical protein
MADMVIKAGSCALALKAEPYGATVVNHAIAPTLATEIRLEEEILLGCARVCLNPGGGRRLRDLIKLGLDWEYLLNSATRHGLIPLLYRHLHATCADVIPGSALERLRKLVNANAAWSMFLTAELLSILPVLQRAGVAAIPFRGPTLAASAYGDLSLRQFSDLDLLVLREDVPKAREALATRGYQPVLPLSAALEEAYLKSNYGIELVNETKAFKVDMHWEVVPRYLSLQIDSQAWWEDLEHLSFGGALVPTLSPAHLLLAVCAHSTAHVWDRLGWICDVAALLESHPGMDWGKVIKLAHGAQAERMLLLGLSLAHDLLGTPLPDRVCLQLQTDPALKPLARRVRQRLFRAPGYRYEMLESIPFHWGVRERLRDKITYCFHLGFTPSQEDWACRRLPPSLSFLHVVFRPFRLMGKYVTGLGRNR